MTIFSARLWPEKNKNHVSSAATTAQIFEGINRRLHGVSAVQ
jgi:hypothetical protein